MQHTQEHVFVISDDGEFKEKVKICLTEKNIPCKIFHTFAEVFEDFVPQGVNCLVLDDSSPFASSTKVLSHICLRDKGVAVIFVTNSADRAIAEEMFGQSVTLFLERPLDMQMLYSRIAECLAVTEAYVKHSLRDREMQKKVQYLTTREKNVVKLLALGLSNKEIGLKLSISYRTAEAHRLSIMKKLKAKSVVDLVHVADMLWK